MQIIKVAIIWQREPWRGAVNYYRSLCYAVSKLPNTNIEIFLFTGENINTYDIEDYVEVVRTPMFTRRSIPWFVWKIGAKLNRDYFLYRLMKRYNIDVISHYESLWEGCSIPSIPWWADFQFLRLSGMFSEKDTLELTHGLKKMCDTENHILLSSNDAKHDLEKFIGNGTCPSIHVLPFVSALIEKNNLPTKDELVKKYQLPELWFFLPNQFWKHKNHKVVIDALGKIKEMNICVIATGKTDDFRNPDHFHDLNKSIDLLGVEKNFFSLGEIPFRDVVSLMEHAVAVINPSLFEGWSTTVEESKALGKKIILSDIPVHREQAPKRGIYFNPESPGTLAEVLLEVLSSYSSELEEQEAQEAKNEYENHIVAFAKSYEKIIGEVLL